MKKPRRRKEPPARILLVLHAHLPYARVPGERFPAQELWLYQNIAECYIPLLRVLGRLAERGIRFPITASLSPALVAMLGDDYYREKFSDYLGSVITLSRVHAVPGGGLSDALERLADRLEDTRAYWDGARGDLASSFRALSERGTITLITTAATHALLPAYRYSPRLERLQIRTGQGLFASSFGPAPRGLWLPEMGYHAGLDETLSACGVEYTFLEAHSAYRGEGSPEHGNFMPFAAESGLVVFPRELALSGAVWAHRTGYPGDGRYREFHADYTWQMSELELSRLGLARAPLGIRPWDNPGLSILTAHGRGMEIRIEGVLKSWDKARGFGFITPISGGGQDIFVHVSDFACKGGVPRPGERLTFEIGVNAEGKKKALRVRRPGQRAAGGARKAPQPRASWYLSLSIGATSLPSSVMALSTRSRLPAGSK